MIPDSPADFDNRGHSHPDPPLAEPMHDLYPAMDARFILIEVGKLTAKVDRLVGDVSQLSAHIESIALTASKTDRLVDDVGKLSSKLDVVRAQVSFVKGAAWVIGDLIVFGLPFLGLFVSGKLSFTLH